MPICDLQSKKGRFFIKKVELFFIFIRDLFICKEKHLFFYFQKKIIEKKRTFAFH